MVQKSLFVCLETAVPEVGLTALDLRSEVEAQAPAGWTLDLRFQALFLFCLRLTGFERLAGRLFALVHPCLVGVQDFAGLLVYQQVDAPQGIADLDAVRTRGGDGLDLRALSSDRVSRPGFRAGREFDAVPEAQFLKIVYCALEIFRRT